MTVRIKHCSQSRFELHFSRLQCYRYNTKCCLRSLDSVSISVSLRMISGCIIDLLYADVNYRKIHGLGKNESLGGSALTSTIISAL